MQREESETWWRLEMSLFVAFRLQPLIRNMFYGVTCHDMCITEKFLLFSAVVGDVPADSMGSWLTINFLTPCVKAVLKTLLWLWCGFIGKS